MYKRPGVTYARNGCPSRGTLDIFVEPVLPRPRLVICGTGPVAQALADLATRFDFDRTLALSGEQEGDMPAVDHLIQGLEDSAIWAGTPYIVIATQGKGDLAALEHALASEARYIAFVGSQRKFASLSDKLGQTGHDAASIARVRAPAGLDIRAITPDEIALSILAQIVAHRRNLDRQEVENG